MIGARMLVEGGRVLGIDMPKLPRERRPGRGAARRRQADIRAFVEMLEPVVLDYCVGLAGAPYHVHRSCGDPDR